MHHSSDVGRYESFFYHHSFLLLLMISDNLVAFDRPESSRLYKAMADIRTLETAIILFTDDIGRCPKTDKDHGPSGEKGA